MSGSVAISGDPSSTRMVDQATGIQSVRGGQRVGEAVIPSIIAAYANLMYSPVAAACLLLGLFMFVAEVYETTGPLELLVAALTRYIEDQRHPGWIRNVAAIITFFVHFLIQQKIMVASLLLIWFVWFAKPSRHTLIVALLLSFMVWFMGVKNV